MRAIALLVSLVASSAFAQESTPITDFDKLKAESQARTVFIRIFRDSSDDSERATGVILKDGLILTNNHVLRPFLSNKKTAYKVLNFAKTPRYLKDLELITCDRVNDLCLLRTSMKDLKFFSLSAPSYRKMTASSPLGLYNDEKLYLNGFCSQPPSTKPVIYKWYKKTPYMDMGGKVALEKGTIAGIELVGENDQPAMCPGDSGGPIFDSSLTLYGLARDGVVTADSSNGKRVFGVPVDVVREFVEKSRSLPVEAKIPIR